MIQQRLVSVYADIDTENGDVFIRRNYSNNEVIAHAIGRDDPIFQVENESLDLTERWRLLNTRIGDDRSLTQAIVVQQYLDKYSQ